MKKIILSIFIILALISCNDDFLEKFPLETQSEATAFVSYANFQTYSWGLYDIFYNNASITRTIHYQLATGRGDAYAGYLNHQNRVNDYANDIITPFASAYDASAFYTHATGGWDFAAIRNVCLMLDNINQSSMSAEDKAHWRSVGYFFHSFQYMELVSRYGDVPWVNHALAEDDPIQTVKRTSRTVVVDSIMNRLKYAEANIYEMGEGAGTNTINKACVQVLISRFGLFEATWRKYHNVSDDNSNYNQAKLLQESVRASEAIMNNYSLGAYDDLYNSPSLADNPGVILYKQFETGVLMHMIGRYCRTAAGRWDVPKHTVDLYLSQNGLPIHNAGNTQYEGDRTMYNEFRNRDKRLYASVIPPYYDAEVAKYDYSNPDEYNTDVNEYVNLIPSIFTSDASKRLPASGFRNSPVIPASPNIVGIGINPARTWSGYSFWRYYNQWEINDPAGQNIADMPIFHLSEVLLNYAEAKWELGAFDQAAADASINLMRQRAGVANMVVGAISADFDPDRDPNVAPVAWEIRRERIVELLGEGFGFDDIRRWKTAPWFINRDVKGCYLRYSDYKVKESEEIYAPVLNINLIDENGNDLPHEAGVSGYVKIYSNQVNSGRGWLDKHYLLPLPEEEVTLNPNLLPNNPGW